MTRTERKVNWGYYLAAGIITIVVFLSGMYFSVFLDQAKIADLENSIKEIRLSQENADLEIRVNQALNGTQCHVLTNEINGVISQAADLGERLEFYEANERFQDPVYPTLKKEYTVNLIKYWLFAKDSKQSCNYDYDIVLYFYSNEGCDDCVKQGTVLSYLKKRHPQDLMVFAIDEDIDISTISLLKSAYNITQTPTVVINERDVFLGHQNLNEMTTILNITDA